MPVRHLSRTHARQGEDGFSQLLPPKDSVHFVESGDSTSSEATSPYSWTRTIAGRLGGSPLRELRQPLCKEIRTPGIHPAFPVVSTLDKRPLEALTRSIMGWPRKFVQKLEAPFIHSSLQYAQSLPAPLEGAFSACALYLSRTAETKDIVMNIIERKVNQLVDLDLSVLSVETHLTSLQAFLMLHIIQLWDGDVRQRAQAEMHSYTLESWALVLHMRIAEESKEQDADLTWDQWIMLESARRTTLMTLMAQGIFEMHKYGVCTYVPNMSEMPFTTIDGPWNAPGPDDWKKEVGSLEQAAMTKYCDYANSWKASALPSGPSAFGRLLLIPCLACSPRGTFPSAQIELLD